MRNAVLLLPVLALAACSTPREDCISGATRDVRVMDGLIAETRGNLQRGFAIEEDTEVRTVRRFCEGKNEDGTTFRFRCDRNETVNISRPVAIDLNAEQAKLESLLDRQAQNRARADDAVLKCIAVHPE